MTLSSAWPAFWRRWRCISPTRTLSPPPHVTADAAGADADDPVVLLLVVTHISYQDYIGETHWLLWLLGPATIAFAVPVYENLHIIRRHWLSLTAGVTTAVLVAVYSSVGWRAC